MRRPHDRRPAARLLWRGALATALAVAALSAGEAPAMAQPSATSAKEKEAARALAQLGYELFEAKKYQEALAKLDQAEELFHAPPHIELAGRCLEKLGRLLQARERYQRVAAEPPAANAPKAFRDTHAAAVKALDSLKTRIPTLQVKVTGAAAERTSFSIDGKPVAGDSLLSMKELDPGSYALRIEAPGAVPESRTVTLEEGSHQTLELALKEAAPGGGDRRGPLAPGIIVLGAGVAGLVIGAVTGAASLGTVGGLSEACPEKHCPDSQAANLNQAKTLATVSTVGFVAGGALAAAGVTLLVVRPFGTKTAGGVRMTPVIGLGRAGVEGVF